MERFRRVLIKALPLELIPRIVQISFNGPRLLLRAEETVLIYYFILFVGSERYFGTGLDGIGEDGWSRFLCEGGGGFSCFKFVLEYVKFRIEKKILFSLQLFVYKYYWG